MNFRNSVLALAALAGMASGCARNERTNAQPSIAPLLIDKRGVTMPLEYAVKEVSFRPYLPPGTRLGIAVIPPLGGNDTRKTRGIAIEYATSNAAMVLSEWPKQRFALPFPQCGIKEYGADAYAWTSRRGLAFTLQPDGETNASAVENEARKLLRAGACD